MKKLISERDVAMLVKDGKEILCLFPGMILTPAGRDAAKDAGLTICEGKTESECEACKAAATEAPAEACGDEISGELVYEALKAMVGKGMLKGVADILPK